ncbi:MAG: alpha-glucan family phosphorylase [Bacteroidetes bacterium]|nr:alpha-glucan family phosphorylase [Bacteroidota bacterium]
MKKPEYLFEVSWEVCNMVGGIYTVLSSKARLTRQMFGDHYITIGPDVWKRTKKHPLFIEDPTLFAEWRKKAAADGLRFRVGRWNIPSRPVAILIDFTTFFGSKNDIFAKFWETYQLDSLHGQWDYIEPAMFGYAAGKVIESFYLNFIPGNDKAVAHFHEWMTGVGVLYLKQNLPQLATVFTTHATFLGRCISSNGLPLYRNLTDYQPSATATRFGITSQQSLESLSAKHADAFTTVSEITARECEQFLGRKPDVLTINGFDDMIAGDQARLRTRRIASRKKILKVASLLAGSTLPEDTLLVLNSGRYEFKNKGIDLFIQALNSLQNHGGLQRPVVGIIAVPANHSGPVHELRDCLENPDCTGIQGQQFVTHFIPDHDHDPVLQTIQQLGMHQQNASGVHLIFVPVYLNGDDKIFNLSYYDFLSGMDLTVFPSYYEPWGYTPLESISFGVPTITTSLAGFGLWVRGAGLDGRAVHVIDRNEDNTTEVFEQIAALIRRYAEQQRESNEIPSTEAQAIAGKLLWNDLIVNYQQAWNHALTKLEKRAVVFESRKFVETLRPFTLEKQDQPTWKKVLIQPVYTRELQKLHEIAQNLWWSWNYEATALFESIDPKKWEEADHNPIPMMESLSAKQMDALENNPEFIARLNKVYAQFKAYMDQPLERSEPIAYFSMEFGLHKSLKIYSGGLGVLAGDYLKEASDSRANIIGVGLLYRYGYFQQEIAPVGNQVAQYIPQKFTHLPLEPVRDEEGNWVMVSIALPGRNLTAKAWRVPVGRVSLYLLDTDIEENNADDRSITHQLYGGDNEMRFKQEMVLGIGGIRLLRKIGINPLIYHSNEGHSAFIGLERLRMIIKDHQVSFDVAKEIVRASTLFTTHTPVPAGHDNFDEDLLRTYMPHYPERLGISWDDFVNLGKFRPNEAGQKFSMSVLATNLSQEVNGVSQIHGRVSREMFQELYPGYFANELHIGHVTNGVHYFTWTDPNFQKLYKSNFPEDFEANQHRPELWQNIYNLPAEDIWQIRQQLKSDLTTYLKYRLKNELTRRQESPKLILRTLETINDKALIIGFARRFATYKRAHLLFHNLERLAEIVNRADRPVIFVYAGKAHPRDGAGQDLIKRIIEVSRMPQFTGKVLFIENYDMELGKRLTSSCDIWLNTPTRPMEASGTSGEKAVMNGVLNFSVLDGWWAEGYKPNAGWAIQEKRTYENQQFQDELDAETIYNLLENEIIPAYYDRNAQGIPERWVKFIQNNLAMIAPHYTMKRMLEDYYAKFYNKLIARAKAINAHDFELAQHMAAWKKKVSEAWNNIEISSIKIPDPTVRPLNFGENFVAEITLKTPGLQPGEVGIELLFGRKLHDKINEIIFVEKMNLVAEGDNWVQYHINVPIYRAGVYDYTFRIYPNHPELPHRQDFPLVKWI